MIPKEEQLDLGTQPRYTRQWGYNASTGSTSLFRRFADVFNSGAKEETRLRNALRMQIGRDIASNYVSLAAHHTRTSMNMDAVRQMRNEFPNLAGFNVQGSAQFDNPSDITYRREGGFHDTEHKTTKTIFEYNKNYGPDDDGGDDDGGSETPPPSKDKTPTSLGEGDKPKATRTRTSTKKTTTVKVKGPNGTKKKTTVDSEAKVDSEGIQDAEIIEDPNTKPKTKVTAGTPTKKRQPRPGRQGAEAQDPESNTNRIEEPTTA